MYENDGIKTIIEDWLVVGNNESVLILTDELHLNEAKLILEYVNRFYEKNAVMMVLDSALPQSGEPPLIVSNAMYESDVIIAVTHYSLFTTNAKMMACQKGARYLSLPLANNNSISLLQGEFLKAKPQEVYDLSKNLNDVFMKGNFVRVTTNLGTDVYFDIKDRKTMLLTGKCDEKCMSTSASLELLVPPVETNTNGKIVVDASLGYLGLINHPFEIILKDGKIDYIERNIDGERLYQYIESFNDNNMYVACELGIGLNKKAICKGNSYLEDESAFGTFHVGFGRNLAYGGNNIAKGHYDLVIHNPTVIVDDKVVIKSSKFLI